MVSIWNTNRAMTGADVTRVWLRVTSTEHATHMTVLACHPCLPVASMHLRMPSAKKSHCYQCRELVASLADYAARLSFHRALHCSSRGSITRIPISWKWRYEHKPKNAR